MARTNSPVRTTTSSRSKQSGFTLLEILIVLAIMAMVLSIGLPTIQRVTYQRINSTTRKFVGLIRTVRNDAILLNSMHRLAFDLEKKTYWVETQNEAKLLKTETEETKKKKKPKEAPPSNFSLAAKFSSEPIPMPGGVAIDGILKEREGLVKNGRVYVHFFPSGFNEQAIVYLKRDGSDRISYSLVIRPTSGKVEVFGETVSEFDSVGK